MYECLYDANMCLAASLAGGKQTWSACNLGWQLGLQASCGYACISVPTWLLKMVNRRKLAAFMLLRRRRQKRKVWVKPLFARRAERGEYRSLVQEITEGDEEFFQTYMRMKKDTYHHLLRLIENDITKKDTRFRKSITAAERLALTLRFLGHGDSQAILSIVYRIGKSTVCKIINETTQCCLSHIAGNFSTSWHKCSRLSQLTTTFGPISL